MTSDAEIAKRGYCDSCPSYGWGCTTCPELKRAYKSAAPGGEATPTRCGSQGVDEDGNCLRCGLTPSGPELEESAVECPPGFLRSSPSETVHRECGLDVDATSETCILDAGHSGDCSHGGFRRSDNEHEKDAPPENLLTRVLLHEVEQEDAARSGGEAPTRYAAGQLATIRTIGGEWLLVDSADEDAPIARFSTQGDAMFVSACIECALSSETSAVREDAERYRYLRQYPIDAEYINDHALGWESYDRLTDEARERRATLASSRPAPE